MQKYTNVTSATTTTLVTKDDAQTKHVSRNGIMNISISNNSANAATLQLYLDDGGGVDADNPYYIFKNIVVPSGCVFAWMDNLNFNPRLFSLILANSGTSPDLTIIIN